MGKRLARPIADVTDGASRASAELPHRLRYGRLEGYRSCALCPCEYNRKDGQALSGVRCFRQGSGLTRS